MKVILEPKVKVIAHSQFLGHPDYPIPTDGGDAVQLCAFAAKSCYDSFGSDGRPNAENQLGILEHRHGSVMEHFYVSMFIEGVTRALTLELNRHRLLNISQRSTRYVKEEDSAIVLEPYYAEFYRKFEIDKAPITPENVNEYNVLFRFMGAAEYSFGSYNDQVKYLMKQNPKKLDGFDLRKWARGKARNSLPHCLETRAVYTANLRAWRWIIEVRSGEGAEPEIRRLAHQLFMALSDVAPLHFDDFSMTRIIDGYPVYTPKFSKV